MKVIAEELRELVDDTTGQPVLWTSGRNFHYQPGALTLFPDGRWLRFPVRADPPRGSQ
jgi:hypothetical protein